MRNIICTSLLLLASPLAAEMPEVGCYARSYSQDHLAAHPAQKVQSLRLSIYDHAGSAARWAGMDVLMRDGTRHGQTLICFDLNGAPVCGVECDGGIMEVTRQDKTGLTFRTDYLLVGEAAFCGGSDDLAEIPGEFTTYRLEAAPAGRCEGL